jgi:hypothetical protein
MCQIWINDYERLSYLRAEIGEKRLRVSRVCSHVCLWSSIRDGRNDSEDVYVTDSWSKTKLINFLWMGPSQASPFKHPQISLNVLHTERKFEGEF